MPTPVPRSGGRMRGVRAGLATVTQAQAAAGAQPATVRTWTAPVSTPTNSNLIIPRVRQQDNDASVRTSCPSSASLVSSYSTPSYSSAAAPSLSYRRNTHVPSQALTRTVAQENEAILAGQIQDRYRGLSEEEIVALLMIETAEAEVATADTAARLADTAAALRAQQDEEYSESLRADLAADRARNARDLELAETAAEAARQASDAATALAHAQQARERGEAEREEHERLVEAERMYVRAAGPPLPHIGPGYPPTEQRTIKIVTAAGEQTYTYHQTEPVDTIIRQAQYNLLTRHKVVLLNNSVRPPRPITCDTGSTTGHHTTSDGSGGTSARYAHNHQDTLMSCGIESGTVLIVTLADE